MIHFASREAYEIAHGHMKSFKGHQPRHERRPLGARLRPLPRRAGEGAQRGAKEASHREAPAAGGARLSLIQP